MSRCFSYPPPGYVSNRATRDALIESIKIKRDTERIRKEKKEQKRSHKVERKEEKKEKKEKKRKREKLKSILNIESTNKRKHDGDGFEKSVDKCWVDSKKVHPPKKNETETEQLERSSLSEEHGQPVLAETLSCSSDGTQSKAKKIRMEHSSSNGNCATQGKSVRFRLKRREQESAHPIDDVPSTSGRTSTPITKTFDDLPQKDEPCLNAHVPTADNDRTVAISTIVEASAHDRSDILPICNSSVEKTQKKPKSAYETLFSNWVPPPIHFEAVATIDDEQWMVPCKNQAGPNSLHLEFLNGVSGRSCSSSSPWPRAHLLPEADLYVLPFTVPL